MSKNHTVIPKTGNSAGTFLGWSREKPEKVKTEIRGGFFGATRSNPKHLDESEPAKGRQL